MAPDMALGLAPDMALGLAPDMALGLAPDMALGLAPDMAPGMAPGMALGLAPDMALGLAPDMAPGLAPGPTTSAVWLRPSADSSRALPHPLPDPLLGKYRSPNGGDESIGDGESPHSSRAALMSQETERRSRSRWSLST